MANSQFNIKVNVADGGDIEKIKRALGSLGATVSTTRRQTNDANNSSRDFYDTQKKGIIGTGNSTKSFSKLAETIGGRSSGLVGAYATLAANMFAVTAAFNALRGASQVEQIFRGLEAAGTRTGLSLNTTAKALRDVSGAAISTEQAMRSTAQITSAGFNSDAVERLGRAARDTSFALGRNMTDSLDRLTRGVVKLEPELLDELGIMTKLTESNIRYAQTLGKNETQLSAFEKRQGFMNAVLAEAELKFGGLADAAGNSTAYDKLAASFTDLANKVLNVVNTLLGKPIAGILASSMTLMLGVALSFAASLKNQLLPGLARSAAAAQASAEAFKKEANQKIENIQRVRELAKAEAEQALASKKNFDYIGSKGPKIYQGLAASIRDGTASIEEQRKGLVSLQRSYNANAQILANNKNFNVNSSDPVIAAKGAGKQAENERIFQEIIAIRQLDKAKKEADNNDIASAQKVQAARLEAKIASREALAASASAASIGAASQLQLGTAWKQLTLSVRAYASAQALATGQGVAGMTALKVGIFAVATGARALGSALLSALPYIGLIVTAVGLIQGGWNALKSEGTKNLERAVEALNEVTAKAVQFGDELTRVNQSQAAPAARAAAALTIQSNAIREVSESYEKYLKAAESVDTGGVFASLLRRLTGDTTGKDKVDSYWTALGSDSMVSYQLGIRKGSKLIDTAEAVTGFFGRSDAADEALKTLNSLNEAAPKELEKFVKQNYKSWDNLNQQIGKNPKLLQAVAKAAEQSLNKALGDGADQVKTFQESMKQLETDLSSFYRSAAISTPFDAVVKSVTAANNSIIALSSTYKNAPDFGNLLTGLDANTTSSLSPELQKQIKLYQEADAIVQSLAEKERQRIELLRSGRRDEAQNLSGAEKGSLEIAQKRVAAGKQLVDNIMTEIMGVEKLFLNAQNITRQNAAQLTLLKAQMGANSDIYKAGAAGMRARISDEERVRSIQKAQLSIQVDVLKASIALNQSKIESLNKDVAANEQLINQINNMKKFAQETQKAQLAARGVGSEVLDNLQKSNLTANQAYLLLGKKNPNEVDKETTSLISSYLADTRAINVANEELLKDTNTLRGLQQANRDSLASIQSLTNQIQAINAENLTLDQKRARYQQAEYDLRSKSLTALRDNEKSLIDINATYREADAILNGTTDTLQNQVELIRKAATDQRGIAQSTFNDNKRRLELDLRAARAEQSRSGLNAEARAAANSLVSSAQEALNIAQQTYDVELQKINAQEMLNILQKTYFDTQTKGLEYQQQALSYIQKQVDAQRELASAITREGELRAKLLAKRRGYDMRKSGEEAIDIHAAAEAYKFAVAESQIKKTMIDLEFALLDAQKEQLKEELRVRRDEATSRGDTDRARQLNATIGNLNVDTSGAREAAKQAVDQNIRNLAVELETAMTRGRRGDESIISKLFAATDGARQRRQAEAEALQILKTTKPIEVSAAETVARTIGTQVNSLITANNDLISAIRDWIASIDKEIGTFSEATSGPAMKSIVDIGKYLESKGFSVRENQNFGGVTAGVHKGRGHYEGRALDVSLGAGNLDVTNSEFRAKTIAIAKELASQGITVLFNGIKYARSGESKIPAGWGDHKDHAHVEVPGGWKPAEVAKIVTSAAESAAIIQKDAAKEAGQTFADIVVTGAKEPPRAIMSAANDNTEFNKTNEALLNSVLGPPAWIKDTQEAIVTLDDLTSHTIENLKSLGPQGEVVVAIYQSMIGIADSVTRAADIIHEFGAGSTEGLTAMAGAALTALSSIQSVVAATAQAKVEAVDREIAAEQKRDGKSAESVAKITALEKRKDEIAKKAFNTNKKLMMAQAIIGTAAGVAQALGSLPPPANIIMAGIIGALGAAQLAIIAGTSYQSTSASATAAASAPSTLTIGRQGDTVDLAKQNNNVGGELGYLRGSQGRGTNSSNYAVIPSAYGARDLFRGYGNSAYVVGEKGPETLTPETPITVTPANDTRAPASVNGTINIHALDASGVEEVLNQQRGNLISMFREAANANGQPFLENINIGMYSRPNKTGNKL